MIKCVYSSQKPSIKICKDKNCDGKFTSTITARKKCEFFMMIIDNEPLPKNSK